MISEKGYSTEQCQWRDKLTLENIQKLFKNSKVLPIILPLLKFNNNSFRVDLSNVVDSHDQYISFLLSWWDHFIKENSVRQAEQPLFGET